MPNPVTLVGHTKWEADGDSKASASLPPSLAHLSENATTSKANSTSLQIHFHTKMRFLLNSGHRNSSLRYTYLRNHGNTPLQSLLNLCD